MALEIHKPSPTEKPSSVANDSISKLVEGQTGFGRESNKYEELK